MTEFELLKRKISLEKQWLWMLANLTEDELQMPRNKRRQDAIDEALERLKNYLLTLEKIRHEKK